MIEVINEKNEPEEINPEEVVVFIEDLMALAEFFSAWSGSPKKDDPDSKEHKDMIRALVNLPMPREMLLYRRTIDEVLKWVGQAYKRIAPTELNGAEAEKPVNAGDRAIITENEISSLTDKFVEARKNLYEFPNFSKSFLSPEEKERLAGFAVDEKMQFLLSVVAQVTHALHFLRGKSVRES